MQEQNQIPTEAQKEEVPLEEKGHLTRTQLYVLLAILSVSILGLCGYIVWNSHASVTSDEGDAEQSTDEDITSQEGLSSVNILVGETSTQLTEGDEFVIEAASIDDDLGSDVGDIKIKLTDYNTTDEIVLLEILADRIYDGSLFAHDPIDELELPIGEKTCTAGRPLVMDVALYYCFDAKLSGDDIEITVTLEAESTMPKPTNGWTTYTDDELSYTIEIPYTWTSDECTEIPTCRVSFIGELFSDPKPFLTIYNRNTSELTVDEYVASRELIGETATELTVSGKPAWRIVPENPETEGITYLVVTRSASYLEFQGNPGSEGSAILQIFQQIVETLTVE